MLSADGIFIVVATISESNGKPVGEPEIIFRGVPFPDEAEGLIDALGREVNSTLHRAAREGSREPDVLQRMLHDNLAELVYKKLRRRPMVLPVVIEV
jgi:ribonuclease J